MRGEPKPSQLMLPPPRSMAWRDLAGLVAQVGTRWAELNTRDPYAVLECTCSRRIKAESARVRARRSVYLTQRDYCDRREFEPPHRGV